MIARLGHGALEGCWFNGAHPTDDGPRATALREAHEEIGLLPSSVDVLGRLDDLVTGTGFTIAPFVGWIDGPFEPVANEAEVARVFAVPLLTFFDKARGIPPFHGHTVWVSEGRSTSSRSEDRGKYVLPSTITVSSLSAMISSFQMAFGISRT